MPKFGPKDASRMQIIAFFANPVQTIAKTNRRRRLALASRRRIDRCHQNQLTIRPVLQRIDKGLTDLRLVMTKGQ